MTCQSICNYYENQLKSLFSKRELREIIALAFSKSNNWNKVDISMNKFSHLNKSEVDFHKSVVQKLLAHQPIQYILENVHFYNLSLLVKPGVLIPRPETEELVSWVLTHVFDDASFLDIGTGSGCIALAIKANTNRSDVCAIDQSKYAIEIAKENGSSLNLDVNFLVDDILNPKINNKWDFIISNPPYIPRADKNFMEDNVLKYEPHTALFVDDNNPLFFYEKIANFSLKHLKKRGYIFFEIHSNMGFKIVELLASLGFKDIEIKKDLQGKNRMIKANLK